MEDEEMEAQEETEEEMEEGEETSEETEEAEEKPALDRKMYKAVCSECGKDTEVPFEPDPSRPVYCRDCFQKRRKPRFGSGGRRGGGFGGGGGGGGFKGRGFRKRDSDY